MLNKQLSLRCFYGHKKHKISIKSYAQDVVYEHKMLFMNTDKHRWALMSTRWCTQMLWAQEDAQNEHKMLFMSKRYYLWAQKA